MRQILTFLIIIWIDGQTDHKMTMNSCGYTHAYAQGSQGYSVTRLGDFLDFGQPFKAGGNTYFTQIAHIVSQFSLRCQNHSFCSEIIFGQLL